MCKYQTAARFTADFGVKTNAKLTPIFKLREKSKTGIQSCLFTVTLTPILRKFSDIHTIIYVFSMVNVRL